LNPSRIVKTDLSPPDRGEPQRHPYSYCLQFTHTSSNSLYILIHLALNWYAASKSDTLAVSAISFALDIITLSPPTR